jgi:RNA polymerase sigma-70 factor (ECF subfamily)
MEAGGKIVPLLASGLRTEAFDALLAAFQDKVFRLCYSMLGDRAQAEDAAQESFLRIWKSFDRYRGESSPGTRIFAVTRNDCLTAISKRSGRKRVPLEEAERFAAHEAHGERDIFRWVAKLPDNYRQVVMLYYMEDKSYEEVARMLDLPLGTVKTNLHRARKQLATMIEEAERGVGRV